MPVVVMEVRLLCHGLGKIMSKIDGSEIFFVVLPVVSSY